MAINGPGLCDVKISNRGTQIQTASAVIHGLRDVNNPKIVAAPRIIPTVIPVSSQPGRESIQAITRPDKTASASTIFDVSLIILENGSEHN